MANKTSLTRYSRYAREVLHKEGGRALAARSLHKVAKEVQKSANKLDQRTGKKKKFHSIVDKRDVMRANPTMKMPPRTTHMHRAVNWVISPPRNGGGHMNMFRFIEWLDSQGFTNNIYLYSTHDHISPEEAKRNVSSYAKLNNTFFFRYKSGNHMALADAVFATGWETAYPVLNEYTGAKKLYFIQDFEPLFYPVGTEYVLAENTYRFGFHGITAGRWLAKKLHNDYGMLCDAYDFGADTTLYTHTNHSNRKAVFFYARPVTERRAFELGIMALELFHEKHPDYTIHLAGWDVSSYDISFPYQNHKTLNLKDLGELYNECCAGLVLSLTNMSLLPLELLACGVIPIVNEGENNRLVSSNPYIEYSGTTPKELSDALSKTVTRKDQALYAKKASGSIAKDGWSQAKKIFTEVMEREVYG